MKYASLFLTKKFIIINTKNITRRYGKASPDKLIKEKDSGFIKLLREDRMNTMTSQMHT
jgi:hypothetical protein